MVGVTQMYNKKFILGVFVRLSFQCLYSLAWKIQQNAPSLEQEVLLAPLPKYLQLGLIIDTLDLLVSYGGMKYTKNGETLIKTKSD